MPSQLKRQVGLGNAVSLNMMNMIGVGPFITLPLVVAAMGGSQAILGWLLGAALAICDGMVWSELGAAMPEAGGSYQGNARWAHIREKSGIEAAPRAALWVNSAVPVAGAVCATAGPVAADARAPNRKKIR